MSPHPFRVPRGPFPRSRSPFRALLPGLVLLLCALPLAARAVVPTDPLPKGWKPDARELKLYEHPSASERELRVTKGILTVVELRYGLLDFERTTLEGANGRIHLGQQDGNLLLLDVDEHLRPGERLPLSVAYRDGTRVELTLVRDELRTDLRLAVWQRPPPTKDEEDAMLAEALARYAVTHEQLLLRRGQLTCVPDEQEEAPRAGPESPQESRLHCEPTYRELDLKMPEWLHRRTSVGRFTINGEVGGSGEQGLLGNGIVYQMHLQTVVLVSVFNMDPERRWHMGEYALRREATGESVRLRAVQVEEPEEGVAFGAVGLMAFVMDTPGSGTERFALEVLEKDGGPRRIRMEGMTFEQPIKDTPAP